MADLFDWYGALGVGISILSIGEAIMLKRTVSHLN